MNDFAYIEFAFGLLEKSLSGFPGWKAFSFVLPQPSINFRFSEPQEPSDLVVGDRPGFGHSVDHGSFDAHILGDFLDV